MIVVRVRYVNRKIFFISPLPFNRIARSVTARPLRGGVKEWLENHSAGVGRSAAKRIDVWTYSPEHEHRHMAGRRGGVGRGISVR
jgi:hypothetical protein